MSPIKFTNLILAAIPLQLFFFTAHLILALFFPAQAFLREALPLVYLAATYAQWLCFAFWISWRSGRYPVPMLMHLPHLLSFLPLLRHVMLAAERTPSDIQSLSLAWVHAVATHSFSLIAAWLWQMRAAFDMPRADAIRKDLIPLALYATLAVTSILLYAGLDLSFARAASPLALGTIQLLLNLAVTALLLFREESRLRPLTLFAALTFSVVNAVLLFDKSRAEIGVELALAATSFTQIFSLYVFLSFSYQSSRSPA